MPVSRTTGILVVSLMLVSCATDTGDGAPLADGSAASVGAAIEAVTRFPTELDQRLWDGADLKPDVRAMSLKIVDRIVATSGIPGLVVDAVELFGSNASYEYDEASDFGIHVFTHSDTLSADLLDPVLRLLNDDVERRQEGHVTFYGVPVEVTFHGARGENYRPAAGIGQYSVSDGRWIERPVKQKDNYDRTQMTTDMTAFIGKYNDLVSGFVRDRSGFDCALFADLDADLGEYRNMGFAKGLGSRSTQNLSYRALRRINVNIPAMLDSLEDECTFAQESLGKSARG